MLFLSLCGMTSATTVWVPVQSSLQSPFEDSKQQSHRSLWRSSSWCFTFIHFCNIKTTHSLIRLRVPRGRHHSLNCRRKLEHLLCPFSIEKKTWGFGKRNLWTSDSWTNTRCKPWARTRSQTGSSQTGRSQTRRTEGRFKRRHRQCRRSTHWPMPKRKWSCGGWRHLYGRRRQRQKQWWTPTGRHWR